MSFKPFLAYSASAGSGKTFALAVRYLSLLFMGESPGSILAATFTKKAVAEMQQRVVDSLRDLQRDKAFFNAVIEQTGLSGEELLAKQPEVLARFLASSSYIVTLDSFFSSILRSAALEIGLEPDFVTKEVGNDKLELHFLDQLQAEGLLGSLVRLVLDIEDKRFKKTFEILQSLYRIDPLLPEDHYRGKKLKAVEDKINVLREQIRKSVIESGASATAIKNFEPCDIKILFHKNVFEKRSLLEHRNYKKYVEKYPRIDEYFLELKALLSRWAQDREAIVLHNLFKVYSYYKNTIIDSTKANKTLTFDDLGYFTYRLLYEGLSREFIYFKIDAKFKHILLDEFQDTSTLQFLLLKPLIDEIFAGQGQSGFKSFFYVGDTKQSLYRFRGGVEELFDVAALHYGIDILPMDTNYRSHKNIIEQVNRWFEPIMQGYIPQKSHTDVKKGYVEVIEEDELIAEAVKQAKRLLALGVHIDDIAFLVSTNKDGQDLQEACEREGIETLLKTSSSLNKLPKVVSLTKMLRYLYEGEAIDAKALLARLGRVSEDVRFEWYHPFMNPVEVLHRLIEFFGYFDEDKNILKLLAFASHYNDIPTFLEEFESSKPGLAEHSVHGANIMTIHGSKGLEFEYVILLDKIKGKGSDTAPLLFDYDESLHVKQIFYRTSSRENFDAKYKTLIEKRKLSAAKDELNVLYVALTRAIKGLMVIKKSTKSIFEVLRLEPLALGSLEATVSKEKEFTPKEVKKSVTLTHYGKQEVSKKEDEEEKDYEAILFGTALHYTLEIMGGFDASSLSKALVSLRNRYGQQLGSEQIGEVSQRISMLISSEKFKELLFGAKITKERSLSYNGELKQVDLLLEYNESCLVVDYKSSKKYHLKHYAQVKHYAEAIEKLTSKPTKGLIIYLLDNAALEFVDTESRR